MQKVLVIGRYQQPNKYTLAALVGILETSPILTDVQVSWKKIIQRENPSEILRKVDLTEFDKIFVLLPVLSTQANFLNEEMKRLKEIKTQNPSPIIIIAGGPHPTYYPEDVLNQGVDFVVRGEAEESFPRLIKAVIEDTKEWRGIPGVAGKDANKLVKNTPDFIPDLDPYAPFSIQSHIFSPIEITRGCPFGCYFCSVSSLYGGQVRHRSIDSICKWLGLAAQHNYERVWFTCPNSFGYGSPDGRTGNPAIVQQMLKRVAAIPGLKQIFFGTFPSEVRPEFVTPEMLDAVSPYIANKSFTLGAQSASNSMLDRIHRQHTFEDVLKAIDLMRARNFRVDVDFIFGLPGETEDDKQENLSFFQNVLKTKDIRIHGHTFLPLPGTKFQNAPPGEIAEEYKGILGRLALKKKAFGSFLVQEDRARDLSTARRIRGR